MRFASLRIGRIQSSLQTIRLQGDQIDIENDIDWHEKHVFCSKRPSRCGNERFRQPTRFLTARSSGPTTRNNSWEKGSLRCRRCAGPIFRALDPTEKCTAERAQPGQVWIRCCGQRAAADAAALAYVARSGCRPGTSSFPLRALSACGPRGKGRAHRAPRLGVQLSAPGVVTTAHTGSLPAEHSFCFGLAGGMWC